MAGVKTNAASGRTPKAPRQTSTADTTTKLRDSCQACAISKVKCPKEKPTCSRCESRGLVCQYIFTRRPGRRREPRNPSNAGISTKSSPSIDTGNGMPMGNDTIQARKPSAGSCFLSCSTTPLDGSNNYLDMSPQGLGIPESPRPDHMFATETSDVFSVLGEASIFSTLADLGSDGNDVDFIMSAMSSPFGMSALDGGGVPQPHNDIGSLLIPPQGINTDVQSSYIPRSSVGITSASSRVTAFEPDIRVLTSGKSEVTRTTDTTSCGCLTQSLDLLKTLSAQPASKTSLSGPEYQEVPSALAYGSTHSVLIENKQSIEAVSERLACPFCAGDNFLLAVLSMTVLKILERYAAAARAPSTSDWEAEKGSRLANSMLASSKDQMMVLSRTYNNTPRSRGRKAAQLVLSELHRVQRLVNQLSPRLKRSRADGERRNVEPELEFWGWGNMTWGFDQGPSTPFSATTLGQMESDVRKSLSTLSSEIINGLRQS